jgi:hypothetical protein
VAKALLTAQTEQHTQVTVIPQQRIAETAEKKSA